MSNASVIRPGLLVSLKSTLRGGVRYERVDINTGEKLPDGAEVSEWKTKRVIEDKEEYDRATKIRGQARSLIVKVCSSTSFGLLCPNDQEGALDEAVKTARKICEEFNDTAKHSRLGLWTIKGRVASDDAEAARAITQEIAELTVQMDAGIKAFDPEAIRKAATRARELSSMLSDEKQTKINAAIEQARKAARTIVKRIETEGEDRATVLLDIQRGQIESARIAFLDMSGDTAESTGEQMPVVAPQRFADLDVESDDVSAPVVTQAPARQMEVE
jgi:hypothetical protein